MRQNRAGTARCFVAECHAGRYAPIVGTVYLMSRQGSPASWCEITDNTGTPQFAVSGDARTRLSMRDAAGVEAAIIRRQALRWKMRYEIDAAGQVFTVSPGDSFGQRFEFDSAAGHLTARGNFSGRRFWVTRAGLQAVATRRLPTLRVAGRRRRGRRRGSRSHAGCGRGHRGDEEQEQRRRSRLTRRRKQGHPAVGRDHAPADRQAAEGPARIPARSSQPERQNPGHNPVRRPGPVLTPEPENQELNAVT